MKMSIEMKEMGRGAVPWSLESDLDGSVTLEQMRLFTKLAIIKTAERALEDEQAIGFEKNPRKRVDNKWDRPEEVVKWNGKIEYYSKTTITEALTTAYDLVVSRSPVDSGTYRRNHTVVYNGKVIAQSKPELEMWLTLNAWKVRDRDVIRIFNPTPYAARLEVRGVRVKLSGRNKGDSFVKGVNGKVGNGAYYLAALAVRRLLKAQGTIKFEMLRNNTGGISVPVQMGNKGWMWRNSYISDAEGAKYRRKRRKRFDGPYVFPSIKFVIAGGGLAQ